MRALLGIAVAAALAAPALAQPGPWLEGYEARRHVTVFIPEIVLPGDDAAIVSFYTGGRLKADGSDIRVVSRGKEVPYRLYGLGPGDLATLAFKVERGVRDYYIYFGSAKAQAPRYGWEPERGLILETRQFTGGNPNGLPAMLKIWGASGPFYGAGAVDRVWQGQNMFGPSDRFASHYVGALYAATQGSYEFATSSDDASFLLVDGRLVVEWPGWHGPVGDARHRGKANLSVGLHRFEYYHVSGGGSTCAVAAWRVPGGEGFQVIPETAFAPLSRAAVDSMELAGGHTAPDFDFEITGEALMSKTEELYAVKIAFNNRTGAAATNAVNWDFGDGQKGRGPTATHVYLAQEIYPVKMTLGAGASALTVTHRIQVHQHWGWQTRKDIDDITTYADEISKYDIERLDVRSCVNLLKLAEEQGSLDFARRVALAVVRRPGEATPETIGLVTEKLRAIWRPARLAEDKQILAAYEQAFAAAEGRAKAAMAAALADADLERGDAARAAEVLREALAAAADDATKRRLYIMYADAARYAGDREAAKNALLAADAIAIERTAVQRAALGGAMAFKVEDYIAHKEYDDAEEALDTWDWERPLEKLEGYSAYLRGTLYHGQTRDARARRELEAIVAVTPESAYAPKALVLVAKIEQATRNIDAARTALGKVVKDYQTSPEAGEAKRMLLSLGG